MLYTEEAVKANIRNRQGKRVFFQGKGDTLTPGARDWLRRERIEILPAEQAKNTQFRLENGACLGEKPENMTHLQGNLLVEKTHPRIRFRGAIDTLESELLLCILDLPELGRELGVLLALSREMIRCEVLEEPLKDRLICGMSSSELREKSHFPQKYYGQPHFMPEPGDGRKLLLLNRLRTQIRETEILALAAFTGPEGNLLREDIPQMLNRMSSLVYVWMIRLKKGETWV